MLGRIGRHDPDADVELWVEQEPRELLEGDSDTRRSREAFDYCRIVSDAASGREAEGEAVGHHAVGGRHFLDEGVEFRNGIGRAGTRLTGSFLKLKTPLMRRVSTALRNRTRKVDDWVTFGLHSSYANTNH